MMDGLPLDMVEEDVGLPDTKALTPPHFHRLALPNTYVVDLG